jgi:hypothetical protein
MQLLCRFQLEVVCFLQIADSAFNRSTHAINAVRPAHCIVLCIVHYTIASYLEYLCILLLLAFKECCIRASTAGMIM